MEYMVSGTPIVTTHLPSMPKEYNQYVYLFNEESVDGFYLTLKSLLEKSGKELHEFGSVAKKFVLDYKSNYKQAERIFDLAEML
jgi:glycosyltransferase involved in cell wall biosynthesis